MAVWRRDIWRGGVGLLLLAAAIALAGCSSSGSGSPTSADVAKQVEQEVEAEHVSCEPKTHAGDGRFSCDVNAGERLRLGVKVTDSSKEPVITSCEPVDVKTRPNEFASCAVRERED